MNAGQYLVTLSGLSGVSAGQHLMAITAGSGTGPGATVFVERMTLHIEESTLTLVRRPQITARSEPVQSPARQGKKQTKRIDVFTAPDQMWLVSSKTTTSHAQGKKNRVICTGDKIIGTVG